MASPNLKSEGVQIFNEKETPSYEIRKIDKITLFGLRVSEVLLFTGFILILLNNMGILAYGTYFGAFSWVTAIVFSIGLIINFIMIPYLYFSSFKNFQKENSCWDRETFLILPSFFFGTFFLYGSQIYLSWAILTLSVIVISAIHYKYLRLSWDMLLKSSNEAFMMQREYFMSLKYLTAYYLLLLFLLVSFNPLQDIFFWIRTHI
ncbi:MAG: hypothetical protein HGA61_04210 [Candidatus Moranbacteria bacterium]|nr:hypothetical protein [Candidatus Moranbacteria bacterium]